MATRFNELFLRQVLTERTTELAVLADKYGDRVLKQALKKRVKKVEYKVNFNAKDELQERIKDLIGSQI